MRNTMFTHGDKVTALAAGRVQSNSIGLGDAINLEAETTAINASGADDNEFDLPAGDEGQEITLYLASKADAGGAVINGAFVGGTTITFDTVGEYAKLKFLGASWAPMHNTGVLA